MLEQVEFLRRVWGQSFHLVEGEVRRRDPKDRPPGAKRLVTVVSEQVRAALRDLTQDPPA